MNTNLKAKLIADINALDGSEELDALLVLAKACQPWLSEFTTQELSPLANLVNNYLASSASDADSENILIASKALQAIDIASQPSNSVVKNIYRGVYNGSASSEETITIPQVNMDKTTVKMQTSIAAAAYAKEGNCSRTITGNASYAHVRLVSETTIGVINQVNCYERYKNSNGYYYNRSKYVPIHWEVIEYA